MENTKNTRTRKTCLPRELPARRHGELITQSNNTQHNNIPQQIIQAIRQVMIHKYKTANKTNIIVQTNKTNNTSNIPQLPARRHRERDVLQNK